MQSSCSDLLIRHSCGIRLTNAARWLTQVSVATFTCIACSRLSHIVMSYYNMWNSSIFDLIYLLIFTLYIIYRYIIISSQYTYFNYRWAYLLFLVTLIIIDTAWYYYVPYNYNNCRLMVWLQSFFLIVFISKLYQKNCVLYPEYILINNINN